MSAATVNISVKADGGALYAVGGVSYDDFYANLTGLYEGDVSQVETILDDVRSKMQPMSGGRAASSAGATRGDAGSPPGAQQLCPTHQQAAVWKAGGVSAAGKAYDGFWKCPQNDTIISAFKGGLKDSCPPPK